VEKDKFRKNSFEKQQLQALGLSRGAERALHAKTWREHCVRRPLSVHFRSVGKSKRKFRLYGFPATCLLRLLCGPIESASTKGVYLELFAQELPTCVGESLAR
jgi:hypothetical protein